MHILITEAMDLRKIVREVSEMHGDDQQNQPQIRPALILD